MNNLTPPDSNNNENQNYADLSLKELKKIAQERQIVPEGNKTKKDTWISALKADDRTSADKLTEPDTIQSIGAANIAESPGEELNSSPLNSVQTNQSTSESRNVDINLLKSRIEQPKLENSTVEPTQNNIDLPQPSINQPESENLTFEPKGSEEAENYILENIVTALDQRRIDVNQLQINFDGQNIFKMNKGDVANSTVTNQQKELIEQALNDPASFKGSIKITNGGQVLLHVKDGQVIRDGLNITKPNTKVEISSAPGDLYDKHAESVNSRGLKATKDVAVNALAAGIEPKQVKEIIESKDSAYADLQASSGKNSADRALNKIIASAEAEIRLKQQKQPTRTKQHALSR